MKKILLFLAGFICLNISAQKTSSGTEFWMAFLRNWSNSPTLRIYISSSYTTKARVHIPGANYRDSALIMKDSVVVITIPPSVGHISNYDTALNRAIHITSDQPVSVSAMNLIPATTDASIVIPLVNIPRGATYITGHPNGAYGEANQFMLVAPEDSTIVDITPANNTNTGRTGGNTYRIRLDKGQLYQMGSAAPSAGLTGTVIKAVNNKKLIVFSGDFCSNWPCGACDHQFEQVLPNHVLDTSYCIPPHFGHTNGYYLKLVPLDNSTNFLVNGVAFNNVSSTNPLIINVRGDSGYYISSTKLFHCYQFLKGANCNGYITNSLGDPAMLSIVSTKHFGQSALFSTVNSNNLRDHFVSIVIPTSAKDKVYHNRSKVDSSEFVKFPFAKSYSYAMLKITEGIHLLECDDGLLAYCYGIGRAESYLYLAGFNLPNFDLDFNDSVAMYDCRNKKIRMQFRAKSSSPLKSYTWYFGDGTTGSGDPITHTFDTFGFIPVKLVGEDFNGKKDSITKIIRVDYPEFDPIRNKIICGQDTAVFEVRNPFFTNVRWMDSSQNRNLKVWGSKDVWVRATDSSGFCRFEDSGTVGKIDIFSALSVDTIENCYRFNRFRFRDSTSIVSDQILHKAWVFPWKTVWDDPDVTVQFPMPGKYKVYFDVYTAQVNCKARYTMDITVHPQAKVFERFKGEEHCSKRPIFFYDSSQVVTGRIASVKWLFDDQTSVTSDSLRTYKSLTYTNPPGDVVRFYRHITFTDKGCTDTALNAVKVWPKPDVSFSLSDNDTMKCLPSARWTFSSTSTTAVDTFDLKWDMGNGIKGTSNDMRNIRYTAPGSYQVKLVALSPFSCHDSLIRTLEVIPLPRTAYSNPDSVMCFNGHMFTMTDTTDYPFIRTEWLVDSNRTFYGKTVDSLTFSTPGIKKVVLYLKSDVAGCEDSSVHTLNLLESPDVRFTANNDTQCLSGNLFNLSNQSQIVRPPATYLWTNGLSGIDTTKNLNGLTFNDTGSYPLYLIGTDAAGCSDTFGSILNVVPLPQVNLITTDSILCADDHRTVFFSQASKDVTRAWKLDGATVAASDSLVLTGLSSGQHRVRVIHTTGNQCSDSAEAAILVLPEMVPVILTDKDTQCLYGNTFNLMDASSAVSDSIIRYEIYTPAAVFNAKNATISFPTEGSYKVNVRIETREGCRDTSANINLTVLPDPAVRIIGDTICLKQEAMISTIQVSGTGISSYLWDMGDGSQSVDAEPEHTYNAPGTYLLKLRITDPFGCTNQPEAEGLVLVRPLPNPSFSVFASESGINSMRLVFIPVLSSQNQYNWSLADGSVSNTDTPEVIISERYQGTVRLRVTDQNGCSDTSSRMVSYYPMNFNVFVPSALTPNGDLLNDVFKAEGIGEVLDFEMRIYNRWGEEVFYSGNPETGWDATYQGTLVPEGVYAWSIRFSYFDGKKYHFRGALTVLR